MKFWIAVGLMYLVIPGIQAGVFAASTLFMPPVELVDTVGAIILFFWMLNSLLLSLKIPVFQRSLPYDRAVRVHVLASTGIALLLLFHAFARILGGRLIDPLSWSLLGAFLLISLIAISWVRTRLFGWFQRWATRKLAGTRLASYDLNREWHGWLFSILSIGMFIHIELSDLFFGSPWWSNAVYSVYFALAMGLHIFSKIRQYVLPRLVVSDVRHLGDVHVVTMSGARAPSHKAGQFGFVSFFHDLLAGEAHPFSFLSHGKDYVTIAVKELGDHTGNFGVIQPGDEVRVNGSFGNFRPPESGSVCMIGSGIGIVPILGILREMVRTADTRAAEVFLSVNTRRELIDEKVLDEARAFPNIRLHVHVFEEDQTLYGMDYFRQYLDDPRAHHYMLCSSTRVRTIVVDSLRSLGVPKRKIQYENFVFG